jgi:hypothetical protein
VILSWPQTQAWNGFPNLPCSEFVTTMTLRSALEDLKGTTLEAVSGLLGKLGYLASLRRADGRHEHWGMQAVYGPESSERAFRTAHAEILAQVLRTPLESLELDLDESSRGAGLAAPAYVKELSDHFENLLPGEEKDSPAARHLNSVLLTLSSLEKHRGRATRSTS